MAANRENLNNPGIFVRIFDEDDFEVRWTDGNALIELATREEEIGGESIAQYLERKQVVDGFAREMYNPWGKYEGVAVLRRLTLHEAVHYLGRNVKLCAFLRPKIQAVRFIHGLEKGKNRTRREVAAEMRQLIHRFDEALEDPLSQSGLIDVMEEQLFNITMQQ
jgi:hypothetical protein